MFILRIIQEDRKSPESPFSQFTSNFELGKAYTKLEKSTTSEFDTIMSVNYPNHPTDLLQGIISGQNGNIYFIECSTILKQLSYFIMTESGQLFEKL
jgi:hypothetical protein